MAYVSVADATTYMGGRLYVDAWTNAADDTVKAAALEMASRAIDRQPLKGRKKDPAQATAFPRCYTVVSEPLVPYQNDFQIWPGLIAAPQWCEDSVPQAVIDATCEEALALLTRGNSERRRMQLEGVQGFSLGSLSEHYTAKRTGGAVTPKGLLSLEAQELLATYLAGSVPIR